MDLSKTFREIVSEDELFKLAVDITKDNSDSGRIWLIGGYLYRNLANYLYETGKPPKDFDFIIENPREEIILPNKWVVGKSRFGNPKFKSLEGIEIDFVPLEKVYSIIKRRIINPTIQDFLDGVPLNIHNLTYEIETGKIEGEIGIASLEQKVVRIYNLEMAQDAAKIYKTTVREMVEKKAKELGFKAELNF